MVNMLFSFTYFFLFIHILHKFPFFFSPFFLIVSNEIFCYNVNVEKFEARLLNKINRRNTMSNQKYLLESERPKPLPGRLSYVTSSHYEGDWKSIPHSHHFAELFYVKSGRGTFIIENQSFPIAKNDLIIINPNTEHTEVSLDTYPLGYIALGVEDLIFSFRDKKNYFLFNCKNSRLDLTYYFLTIQNEIEQNLPGCELICQDLLEILTLYLIRHTDSAFEIAPTKNTNRECSRVKRYIDSNYQDDITLDSLAEMVHLNKYYFIHAFKKYYGQSPMSYLIQKRIQVSRELLESTDYSISDIARLCGFSSPSYFSQCFRKHCDISAQDYRRQRSAVPRQ